jgi:hypothetical protein
VVRLPTSPLCFRARPPTSFPLLCHWNMELDSLIHCVSLSYTPRGAQRKLVMVTSDGVSVFSLWSPSASGSSIIKHVDCWRIG